MRLSGSLAAPLSGTWRLVLAVAVAAPLWGCKGSGMTADAAVFEAGAPLGDPNDLVSDFSQDKAMVLPLGDPARNGLWYAYNDASATCQQSPAHGEPYYPSTPPVPAPGASGGRALHAAWIQCATWGGGVGADLGMPVSDAGAGSGPRAPYDLQGYTGFAFWAMAAPGTASQVRAKVVMRASTQIEDHGACEEAVLGPDRCGDEWGEPFSLPTDGSWAVVTVKFSDAAFKQEGWGQAFAWNPADVFGIQFQSIGAGGLYDFWIDDVYLVR
jgi:hypothetical protein